jgi:hypothetical protein
MIRCDISPDLILALTRAAHDVIYHSHPTQRNGRVIPEFGIIDQHFDMGLRQFSQQHGDIGDRQGTTATKNLCSRSILPYSADLLWRSVS